MSGGENPPQVSTPPSGRTPESGDLRARERQEGWAVPIDAVDAFTLGAAIAVAPDKIEQELTALWRKAAERAQSTDARFTVTRACLWNFIIHSNGEEEFFFTKRLIDEMSESVPARILSLYETSEAEKGDASVVGDDGSPLRASVEANFRRSGTGRREVLAEEITLEAPHIESNRLSGLVRSLLLADVPTALFVRNPATQYGWLPRLAPEADRFIFDSRKLGSGATLQCTYNNLQKLYRSQPAGGRPVVEIADLGWVRLWPWRILLAGLFDPPQATQALRQLDSIEIHHGAGEEPAALLMAGWLLERLGLGPESQSAPGVWSLKPAGEVAQKPAELRLVAEPAQERPVGIVGIASIELKSGDHVFSARGVADSRSISLGSPFQPERVQPVHGRPDSELMVAVMGVGGRDPLMYEALRLGAQLVGIQSTAGAGTGETSK